MRFFIKLLTNHQLVFDLGQFISRNKTRHLFPIPRHFLVHNGHLFNTKVTTLVHLFSKTGKDIRIQSIETNTVVLLGGLTVLFVNSLTFVDLDQSLDSPSRVGGQLVLDEILSDRLHCGNILHPVLVKVKRFFEQIHGSPPTIFKWPNLGSHRFSHLGLGQVGQVGLVNLGIDEDVSGLTLLTRFNNTGQLSERTILQTTKNVRPKSNTLNVGILGLQILESETLVEDQ